MKYYIILHFSHLQDILVLLVVGEEPMLQIVVHGKENIVGKVGPRQGHAFHDVIKKLSGKKNEV